MSLPAVSVIIASRHRPDLLHRTLTALTQQDHPQIEVIVVADSCAADQVRARGLPVRVLAFDAANISAARNAGLVLAAAPVVAFLDDDAVPEPTWAARLAAPFSDDRVTQAGGYVRGRNGISFQWRGMAVDSTGRDHPLDLPDGVTLHAGRAGWAIKTQGTNCAFRRPAILAAGGFDPAFRFYLDDADLNLRLAAQGGLTAVVPGAEVHHRFAASDRRRPDRAPRSLFDIGASTTIFLQRHAPDRVDPVLDDLRRAQRRRLLEMVQEGRLEPRDIARLMLTLAEGIAKGRMHQPGPLAPLVGAGSFLRFDASGPRPGRVFAGPLWQSRRLSRRAAIAAADGAVVTVLAFGLWPRRHRIRFDPAGYWCQVGGLFSPSDRNDPVWRPWGFRARCTREALRVQAVRPTGADIGDGRPSVQQDAIFAALQRFLLLRSDTDLEKSYSPGNSLLDRCTREAYESSRRARYDAF